MPPIDNLTLIAPLPTTPNRSMSDAEFVPAADAWVAAQGAADVQRNAQAQQLNDLAVEVQAAAAAAGSSAVTATSAAPRWSSGASYVPGDSVWSPLDFQTYRAKVAMGSAQHRYWQLDINGVWNGGSAVGLQYIEMRGSAGGSDLTSGGTPFASKAPFEGSLANVFSGTGMLTRFDGTTLQIGYQFATPVSIMEYVVAVHPTLNWADCSPRNWDLQWSDDGVEWHSIAWVTEQINWTAGQARTFTAIAAGALDPSLDASNWARISGITNADTVDNFHASQTPVAGQIPVLKSTGDLPAPGGVRYGNVTSSDPNVPNWYEVGNFDATASGGSAPVTGNIKFVRFGSLVVMSLPVFALDSNANSFSLGTFPTTVRPAVARKVPVRVRDNGGTIVWGVLQINTSGTCTIYKSTDTASGSTWTATTGSKVLYDGDISYTL